MPPPSFSSATRKPRMLGETGRPARGQTVGPGKGFVVIVPVVNLGSPVNTLSISRMCARRNRRRCARRPRIVPRVAARLTANRYPAAIEYPAPRITNLKALSLFVWLIEMTLLAAICKPNGWFATDDRDGQRIDLDAESAKGWEWFREYRDR